MSTIIRHGVNPQDQALEDNTKATAQRNSDIIEYIAMMTDVEIPTDEAEVIEDE